MTTVTLPNDLGEFAAASVASGRFASADEMVAAAMRLLRDAERRREALTASLEAAEAEAERDGYFELDDVLAESETRRRAAEA